MGSVRGDRLPLTRDKEREVGRARLLDLKYMKELQKKIEKFNEERDWDQFHSPENLAKSISIEAGELLECFQWNNEYDLDEVKEELADVINYCLLMADKLGVDPKQIVLDKMEKTAKKYPIQKAKGKSTKYNKL